MSFKVGPDPMRFERIYFAKVFLADAGVLFCGAIVARHFVNILSTLWEIWIRQIVKVTIFPVFQMTIFVEIKLVENHVAHLRLIHRELLKKKEYSNSNEIQEESEEFLMHQFRNKLIILVHFCKLDTILWLFSYPPAVAPLREKNFIKEISIHWNTSSRKCSPTVGGGKVTKHQR